MKVEQRIITATAVQQFDTARFVQFTESRMSPRRFCAELVDNALDAMLENSPTRVEITFNSFDNYFQINQTGTTGMSKDTMTRYTQWASPHKDASQNLGYYQIGGKVALLSLANRTYSNITLASQQPGSPETNTLTIENWWSNLHPNAEFPITTLPASPSPHGNTTIRVSGINTDSFPHNLPELAYDLGLVYGPAIESGLLTLVVNFNGHIQGRRKKARFTIRPITPTLQEGKTLHSTPIGKRAQPRIHELSWGFLSLSHKETQALERKKEYGTAHKPIIGGVYIYHQAIETEPHKRRLIEIKHLRDLDLTDMDRYAIENFAVTVAVGGEGLDRDFLKTEISPQIWRDLKIRIAYFAGDDIKAAARKPDTKIPEQHLRKAEIVTTIINKALTQLFGSTTEFAPPQSSPRQSPPKLPTTVYERPKNPTSAPQPNYLPPLSKPPEEHSHTEVRVALSQFDRNYPPASVGASTEGTVVVLNTRHDMVADALKDPSPNSILLLTEYVATALFTDKYSTEPAGEVWEVIHAHASEVKEIAKQTLKKKVK